MNFTTVLKFNLVFHALKPISAVVSHFNSHLAPAGVVILHPPTKVLSCCLIRPSWIEVYSARIIENTSVVLLYSIYQRFGYCQWKACIENTIFQNINKRLHTFGSKMDTFFFLPLYSTLNWKTNNNVKGLPIPLRINGLLHSPMQISMTVISLLNVATNLKKTTNLVQIKYWAASLSPQDHTHWLEYASCTTKRYISQARDTTGDLFLAPKLQVQWSLVC